jgi:hypothetical protein
VITKQAEEQKAGEVWEVRWHLDNIATILRRSRPEPKQHLSLIEKINKLEDDITQTLQDLK